MLVDERGLPVRIVLARGQASDKAAVPALIERLPPGRDLVADRGHDARAIRDMVAAKGGVAHVPTSRDRKVQRTAAPHLYRRRNLVERFFNRLKQFRRIATRYDKHAVTILTAVMLATTRI